MTKRNKKVILHRYSFTATEYQQLPPDKLREFFRYGDNQNLFLSKRASNLL